MTAELPDSRIYMVPAGDRLVCLSWDGLAWRPATGLGVQQCPAGNEWLRLHGGRCAKLWRWSGDEWTKEGESPATWFRPELVRVDDTAAAWAAAWRTWIDDSETMLVRGVQARAATAGGMVRRVLRPEDGAWLGPHPVGRRVLVLDLDELPAVKVWRDWPGEARWPTIDEAAELVRRALRWALTGRFWGVAAAFRWSASAGVPGGARGPVGWSRPSCHAAIVLDRPVYDEPLRRWLRASVPAADASVSGSVHPLYLAAPTFDGAASPWPADFPRVGLLEGEAVAEAPAELVDGWAWQARAAEEEVEAQRRAEEARWRLMVDRLENAAAGGWQEQERERARRYVQAAVRAAVDELLGAGKGSRHDTLRSQATGLGRLVAGGLPLDAETVRAELLAAWGQAAPGRGGEGKLAVDWGLDAGAREPRTWEEVRHGRR